ncbi:hypothetical protein EDE04_6913 [Streptomyces sp. 2132.2]|nr:hypothetical protein EDE04_6913 [Streptomyces sp. 2132.2]
MDAAARAIVLDVGKAALADSPMLNKLIRLRHADRPLVPAGRPPPTELNQLVELASPTGESAVAEQCDHAMVAVTERYAVIVLPSAPTLISVRAAIVFTRSQPKPPGTVTGVPAA